MASPIGIPPLQEGQTISTWRPLFEAAVSTLIQNEGGQKAAIRLLPAYVNRGKMECKVVIGTLNLDTLDAAFTYLTERLDPEVDEFAATERFRLMTWSPGEQVTDFFTRYLEEAARAKLTPKQVCRFVVTQLPPVVHPKLKEWIVRQAEDLSEDGAMKMAIEIRQALTDRGIPLDKGWRGAAPERVYYTKPVERTPSTESLETVSSDYEDGTIRVIHEKGPYPRNERARGVRATREKGHEELRNRDALDVANRATSFATVPITNSRYPRKEDMMHAIAHPI